MPLTYMILMICIGRTHGTAAATQCVRWWPPSSLSTPRAWAMTSPHQGLILAILSCHFYLAAPKCQTQENFLKPRPWGFPGLRPGDRWCLCSRRWRYLAQLGLLLQHLHQCLRCPWAWTLKDPKQISLCFPPQASDERGQSSPGGIGGFSQKRSSSELPWGDEQSIRSNWGRFAIKIQVERTCEPLLCLFIPLVWLLRAMEYIYDTFISEMKKDKMQQDHQRPKSFLALCYPEN